MAQEIGPTLDRIAQKSRFLLARYSTLAEEYKRAMAKVRSLEERNRALEKELADLRAQVEYFKVSSSLAPQAGDMEATRELLASLLRQVDSCLEDLQS